MRTAKLIGNGLLSLSLVCWIVGCAGEDETITPAPTEPITAPTGPIPPSGEGDHDHAEGEADHEHAEGEADHDHAEEGTEGEATEGEDTTTETEGDAQASLELPEPIVTGVEETNLDLPVVEAGSGT